MHQIHLFSFSCSVLPQITLEAITADGKQQKPEDMAAKLLAFLEAKGYLRA